MDKDVWIAVIGACGGIALTGLIEIVKKIIDVFGKKKNKKSAFESAIEKAVCELLYCKIDENCKKYINRQSITFEEMRDLNRQWKIYHEDLGGNGYLDNSMEAVKDLPIK